jgi:hypothetical protein
VIAHVTPNSVLVQAELAGDGAETGASEAQRLDAHALDVVADGAGLGTTDSLFHAGNDAAKNCSDEALRKTLTLNAR